MTTLREAAQQALEALLTYEQYIQPLTNYFGGPRVPEEGSASAKVDAAITALRAALADQDRGWYTIDEINAKFDPESAPRRAALAGPVQEPAAWMQPRTLDGYLRPDLGYETCSKSDYGAFPVYSAPPQRKPLTEEEIKACEKQAMVDGALPHEQRALFARAIEKAHGIE